MAALINFDKWFLIIFHVGTISKYLNLYMHFMVEIYIKFVGWFRGSVVLKKKGCILGLFSKNLIG